MIYLPIYRRSPNKLLKFEERPFQDRSGHSGLIRIAIYLDAKKKAREEIAQVIWSKQN